MIESPMKGRSIQNCPDDRKINNFQGWKIQQVAGKAVMNCSGQIQSQGAAGFGGVQQGKKKIIMRVKRKRRNMLEGARRSVIHLIQNLELRTLRNNLYIMIKVGIFYSLRHLSNCGLSFHAQCFIFISDFFLYKKIITSGIKASKITLKLFSPYCKILHSSAVIFFFFW